MDSLCHINLEFFSRGWKVPDSKVGLFVSALRKGEFSEDGVEGFRRNGF
jgi:hypothetical protein